MKKLNITGRKFGRLTAIETDSYFSGKTTKWLCECECGNTGSFYLQNLIRGRTKSCGCIQWPGTHNKYNSKIYRIWGSMIQRCSNNNNHAWKYYGGRGISVCTKWLKFENFYNDMGDKPDDLTLERVDNEKGYSKSNCVWATRKEQSRNTRSARFIEHNGERLTLREWADRTGINSECIRSRLRRGWSISDAINLSLKDKR